MKQLIHSGNYESFYLDYLEGTLSEQERVEFEAFMAANSHLMVDEDLVFVEPVKITYSSLEKSLLQKEPLDLDFENNLDFYAISLIENQLQTDEIQSFRKYLTQNKAAQHAVRDFVPTRLQAETVIYSNKESLKRKEVSLIPTWKWIATISGTAAALVILVLPYTERQTNPVSEFSANRTNPKTNSDSSHTFESTPLQAYEGNQKPVFSETQNQNGEKAIALRTDKKDAGTLASTSSNERHHPTILPEVTDTKMTVSSSLSAENAEKPNKDFAFAPSTKSSDQPNASSLQYQNSKEEPTKNSVIPTTKSSPEPEKRGFYIKIGSLEIDFKKGGKK